MKRVLFVCVHNSGRSQMAEAFLNDLSRKRGLAVSAESAGTAAGQRVNPDAQEAMDELGISMAGQFPKAMTPVMAEEADLIITMGCGVEADACPARFVVSEDWGLEDPAGQSIEKVRQIRDEIKERVEALVERLKEH